MIFLVEDEEVEGVDVLAGRGSWKGMKMPLVASDACWRKTVGFADVEAEEEEAVGVVVVGVGRGS